MGHPRNRLLGARSCQAGRHAPGGPRDVALEILGECGSSRHSARHHCGLGRHDHSAARPQRGAHSRAVGPAHHPRLCGDRLLHHTAADAGHALLAPAGPEPRRRHLDRLPVGRAGARRPGVPLHRALGHGGDQLRASGAAPGQPDQEGARPHRAPGLPPAPAEVPVRGFGQVHLADHQGAQAGHCAVGGCGRGIDSRHHRDHRHPDVLHHAGGPAHVGRHSSACSSPRPRNACTASSTSPSAR